MVILTENYILHQKWKKSTSSKYSLQLPKQALNDTINVAIKLWKRFLQGSIYKIPEKSNMIQGQMIWAKKCAEKEILKINTLTSHTP